MVVRILAAMAANESATKSRRVRRKMEQNAAAGLPHGGYVRAFGYAQDKVTVVESEAVVIRQLAERFLAGASLRSLASWLEDNEVATVAGKPWRTTTLRAVLSSGRIAGLREHQGRDRGAGGMAGHHHRGAAPPYPGTYAAEGGERSPGTAPVRAVGVAAVRKCGHSLYSAARQTTRRYVCLSGPDHGGCGRLTVVAAPVEKLIAKAVLYRLDPPELADALAGRTARDEALAEITDQLAQDQAQLEELAAAYADRAITMRMAGREAADQAENRQQRKAIDPSQ